VSKSIACVTLVVRDYEEAIAYFTGLLGFVLAEDEPVAGGKRWVRVAPPSNRGASLLLARAATAEQLARVGDQTGGRVALFLHTDDFWADYRAMQSRGVRFTEQPREEPYGTVAVFLDLYGNRWDLVQPKDLSRFEASAPALTPAPNL
jgi:catechol 2,3-dioxygenase-like lactoylglutathione lyase family enzyme